MTLKQTLKCILPPFITTWLKSTRSPWSGEYSTWDEARKECDGYDKELIIKSIFEAAEKVKTGQFPYERDSVLFDKVVYSWPLSTAICWAALQKNKLSVVDFGGGLGSSFYQNKIFLDNIPEVNWQIVEQKKIVDIGLKKFKTDRLSFFESTADLPEKSEIDLVLLSSTLQYMEDSYTVLETLLNLNPRFILLDRLLVVKNENSLITKQTVKGFAYEASYPCRFLVKKQVIDFVIKTGLYELVSEFESYVYHEGIINGKHYYNEIGLLLRRVSS